MIDEISTHDFLASALIRENKFNSTEDVLMWIENQKTQYATDINIVSLKEVSKDWSFHPSNGNLSHVSSKFFSIQGISVSTNYGHRKEWQQPIIFQEEVGILGLICKKYEGVLYFLLQAKIEPGNINIIQLSPTLQATKSNYTQVHKGTKPEFLEYFTNKKKGTILLDLLQSEQSSRFYQKRNRNTIVEIKDEINVPENFCWLTLGQIKELLTHDNIINMDTRSVISCIDYSPVNTVHKKEEQALFRTQESIDLHQTNTHFKNASALHSLERLISWISMIKSDYHLTVDRIPLKSVKNWITNEDEIFHEEKKYFSVIGLDVQIANREISRWSQPIIKPSHSGLIGFLMKKINGLNHYLVQAKVEAGNLDVVELAPTVQCINDDFRNCPQQHIPAYLNYILSAPVDRVKYSSYQSEEGGRFYHEQHQYMIVETDLEFSVKVPKDYIWMTLSQISLFIRFNNYFNIEARNLIAAIDFRE